MVGEVKAEFLPKYVGREKGAEFPEAVLDIEIILCAV